MSKKRVAEYVEVSSNYVDALNKQAAFYFDQCKLLKSENRKLKEGKKVEDVMDETELKLLEAAFAKLSKLDDDIIKRSKDMKDYDKD